MPSLNYSCIIHIHFLSETHLYVWVVFLSVRSLFDIDKTDRPILENIFKKRYCISVTYLSVMDKADTHTVLLQLKKFLFILNLIK